MQLDVMGHVLALLQREAPRDNLVSSACLGLCEQLRHDNVRPLLNDMAQKHGDILEALRTDPVAGQGIGALIQQQARNQTDSSSDSDDSVAHSPNVDEAAAEQDYFDSEEALDVQPSTEESPGLEGLAPLESTPKARRRGRRLGRARGQAAIVCPPGMTSGAADR